MIPDNTKGSAPSDSGHQKPTSGSENNRVVLFFVTATAIVLFIVLGFNFLGPEGASRTGIGDGPATSAAGTTTGGPSATNAEAARHNSSGGQATQPTSPGGRATTRATSSPQAPDSATPAGREAVGAPKGGAPENTIPTGGSTPTTPSAAITPASSTPASPASR